LLYRLTRTDASAATCVRLQPAGACGTPSASRPAAGTGRIKQAVAARQARRVQHRARAQDAARGTRGDPAQLDPPATPLAASRDLDR